MARPGSCQNLHRERKPAELGGDARDCARWGLCGPAGV